ncbi:hypothetical protein B5K06_28115 [Rhizobium grahamii]|uniref:Uncharacterized protein n=1 Tax=Rhizobium grahamii TaxID=1120045 RepID=A0A370KG82_9HYPH|nr:hypothetical protein B5K06_28115 [Rhizobium grahamii]
MVTAATDRMIFIDGSSDFARKERAAQRLVATILRKSEPNMDEKFTLRWWTTYTGWKTSSQ